MEIKYRFMIYAGAIFCTVFLFLYFRKKKGKTAYGGGIKSAATDFFTEDAYYRKRKRIYAVCSAAMIAAILVGVMASCVLIARPYKSQTVTEEKYSRDIILCIDISTSVDYLNKNVIRELIKTVENLKGERFGIVIFNTSPVLISPLTDDYQYTIEQLEAIEKALDMRISLEGLNIFQGLPDDYLYYSEFISGGTLVGNEERGSSLIGDGLASTIFHFSEEEKDRTKVVILTTDNDLQGEPMVTLPAAALLCEKNDIVVYGVGTKEMTPQNMKEMKKAVENTGGGFYLEEESGSFKSIVEDIGKRSSALTEGRQYVLEKGYPTAWFITLLSAVSVMFLCMKVSKR